MKKILPKLILPALLLLLVVLSELYTAETYDWRQTYGRTDKIPYGTFLLNEMMQELYPGMRIQPNYESFYELARQGMPQNSVFFTVTAQFEPDGTSHEALLRYVAGGNTAFIAARSFSDELLEALKLDIRLFSGFFSRDTFAIQHVAHGAETQKYILPKPGPFYYFVDFPEKGRVISTGHRNYPVMLRIPFGEGQFFIHTVPQVFTNYHLVRGQKARYIHQALAFLPPKGTLVWDSHYKPVKQEAQTPLRYILSQEALRWGYYVLLAALVFLFVFGSKRRMRPIPVINPPANSMLAFVDTVSELYFRSRDDQALAKKKFQHLKEFIRQRFYTDISGPTEEAAQDLAERTGASPNLLKRIFAKYREILARDSIQKEELIDFNYLIDKFYKQIN